MDAVLAAFQKYVAQGGYVMPPLIGAALVLWYALGYRIALLWRGGNARPRELIETFERQASLMPTNAVEEAVRLGAAIRASHPGRIDRVLEHRFVEVTQPLNRFRILVKSIVAIAPLLGLLGTVSGMIETFAALGDMTLFSQSGGIAGGISQALLTTQFGLSIAIPGLVMGRFLERRQRNLEALIEEVKSILVARAHS